MWPVMGDHPDAVSASQGDAAAIKPMGGDPPSFAAGWRIDAVEPAGMETTNPERAIWAWLTTITRV
jgi:hypothetical protein